MSEQPPVGPTYGGDILPEPDLLTTGERRPRRTLGLILGAAATAVAVVAGVTVYAAGQLSGGGRQPESLVPATAFAFAKLDLDPPAGQKLAIRSLTRKFPSAPQGEIEEVFDEFLRRALQGADGVDFDLDINPWLGKRIGIAAFLDGAGSVVPLGVIQSTDDARARAAVGRLVKLEEGTAYLVRDGYVLVAEDQSSLDAATSQLAAGALADDPEYTADIGELARERLVTAWADVRRGYDAALRTLGGETPKLPPLLEGKIKGRVAVGVRADSNFFEMEGISIGGDTTSLAGRRPTVLASLPASTVAVISASDVGEQVDTALDAVGETGLVPTRAEINEGVQDSLGLSLDDELLPLLGAQTLATLGEIPDLDSDDLPKLALLSLVTDRTKAVAIAGKIEQLVTGEAPGFRARVVDDTFYLASSAGYLDELRAGGPALADSARFRDAVGDLDDVAFVVYADLRQLLTLAQDENFYADVRPLVAFGMRAGVRNGNGYFRMRVVVE